MVLQEERDARQQADTLIVRRSRLLETIYDCTTEGLEEDDEDQVDRKAPEPTCKPKAHIRARREAVLAFVTIEQGRNVNADPRGANLSGADLSDANLKGADLWNADLSDANFIKADLSGANFVVADLNGADLSFADLSFADFGRPNPTVSDVNLRGADLRFANLSLMDFGVPSLTGSDVNLSFANVRNAFTGKKLAEACGDKSTKLPEGFKMPDTWLETCDVSGPNVSWFLDRFHVRAERTPSVWEASSPRR